MNEVPYYANLLHQEFARKRKLNPAYSLRAYGRDLGVHPSTLSQVLKGNRPLPVKLNSQLIKKLKLGPKEATLFQESVIRRQGLLDQIRVSAVDRFLLDDSFYKVIAEWEHYAVLTLLDVSDFQSDEAWIAKRLGLTPARVKTVILNLVQSKLASWNEGVLTKTFNRFRTTEDIKSTALISSHLENLELAKEKLTTVPIEERDYSSNTMAIDPVLLPEFKSIIREFREKVAVLSQGGQRTEVYQLGIQLYPLTTLRSEEKT